MVRVGLLFWDLILSFMWAWSGALVRILVFSYLQLGRNLEGEALKVVLSVSCMFLFAWLGFVSGGGGYNPLTVLSLAFSGNLDGFLFTFFGRIPAQLSEAGPNEALILDSFSRRSFEIVGSVAGVKSVKEVFPIVGHGARLKVNIHHGALTEGVLTFMIVMVSLGLKKKDPKSFFMKTWMSSIAKLSLHVLGSDLTGGIMNPASAFGWAYARGDHITLEHIFVYWVSPILATILALCSFRLFWGPKESKQKYTDQEKLKAE